MKLLELNFCAGVNECLLESLSISLGDVLLDVAGSRLNEGLGFLEAEAGSSTNSLDDVDLLGTEALEYNGELGLLLCGAGSV